MTVTICMPQSEAVIAVRPRKQLPDRMVKDFGTLTAGATPFTEGFPTPRAAA